jgi:hypothetical protein
MVEKARNKSGAMGHCNSVVNELLCRTVGKTSRGFLGGYAGRTGAAEITERRRNASKQGN